MTRLLFILAACLCSGCATHEPVTVRSVVRTLTPETMSIGITMPNLISGPTYAGPDIPSRDARQSRFGTIGATVGFTYRLKPIRIERAEVQPVRIVKPVPALPPSPTPSGDVQPHP